MDTIQKLENAPAVDQKDSNIPSYNQLSPEERAAGAQHLQRVLKDLSYGEQGSTHFTNVADGSLAKRIIDEGVRNYREAVTRKEGSASKGRG